MDNFMDNLFGILTMSDNYKSRVVKNTKRNTFTLDTVRVADRELPYETAVAHKDFNDGDWIVLEWSETKEDAERTHDKWLAKLDAGVDSLLDVYTCERFEQEIDTDE